MEGVKSPVDAALLFEQQQALIGRVVQFICRRGSFGPDEAEDFASWVNLKLIDGDYAVLRKFQGRCTLETYLVTVIQRLALDYRVQKWGKWRPSKAAKRLGGVAIQLETLVYRDGNRLEEAVQILRNNRQVEMTDAELEDLFADLPQRTRRRMETEETLEFVASDQPSPSMILERQESRGAWERVVEGLQQVLQDLPVEDRMILRMHYFDGLKISDVARALRLEPKPLYRRVENLRNSIRRQLEREGFDSKRIFDATK